MDNFDEFVALIRDELGLPVTGESLDMDLRSVPGWDSVYLLSLTIMLERKTGRSISMPDILEAQTLGHIYELASSA